MKNFSSDGDSSIFQARVKSEDLAAHQKINEAKQFIEELERQSKAKEAIYERVKRDAEKKFDSLLDDIILDLELKSEQSDDNLAEVMKELYELFGPFFNLSDMDLDPNLYYELREKKNRALILEMIRAMIDKFKKLLRKLFTQDLTWDKRLDKEIAQLEEELNSGELSEEDTIRNLERLEILKKMKLRLQLFAIGLVFTAIFSVLGFEFKAEASQKITEEAYNEAEKASEEKEVKREEGPVEAKKMKGNDEFRQNVENLKGPFADLRKFTPPQREQKIPTKQKNIDLSGLLNGMRLNIPRPEEKPVVEAVLKPAVVQPKPQPQVQAAPASVPVLKQAQNCPSGILSSSNTEKRYKGDGEVITQLASERELEMGSVFTGFFDDINLTKFEINEVRSKVIEPSVENFELKRNRG